MSKCVCKMIKHWCNKLCFNLIVKLCIVHNCHVFVNLGWNDIEKVTLTHSSLKLLTNYLHYVNIWLLKERMRFDLFWEISFSLCSTRKMIIKLTYNINYTDIFILLLHAPIIRNFVPKKGSTAVWMSLTHQKLPICMAFTCISLFYVGSSEFIDN